MNNFLILIVSLIYLYYFIIETIKTALTIKYNLIDRDFNKIIILWMIKVLTFTFFYLFTLYFYYNQCSQ